MTSSDELAAELKRAKRASEAWCDCESEMREYGMVGMCRNDTTDVEDELL